jgi:hypothetical protein
MQFARNPLLSDHYAYDLLAIRKKFPLKYACRFIPKAYETMARPCMTHQRVHSKRPLHTRLTPEEFAKYFAQFCARTNMPMKILEFD